MNIQAIIANSLDLSGGILVRNTLDADAATLACLNVIDAMMLELGSSGKQITGVKEAVTFTANTQTGTIALANTILDEKFVRYRTAGQVYGWQLLEVVDDIEDLTVAENESRRAVVFQGIDRTAITYFLSWIPSEDIAAEIWGKKLATDVASLNDLPPFPNEFALLCAYRTADFVLNQLLLIDDKKFGSFVLAQKNSIRTELFKLTHIWEVYKANPASANNASRVRPFNAEDDLDDLGNGIGYYG